MAYNWLNGAAATILGTPAVKTKDAVKFWENQPPNETWQVWLDKQNIPDDFKIALDNLVAGGGIDEALREAAQAAATEWMENVRRTNLEEGIEEDEAESYENGSWADDLPGNQVGFSSPEDAFYILVMQILIGYDAELRNNRALTMSQYLTLAKLSKE